MTNLRHKKVKQIKKQKNTFYFYEEITIENVKSLRKKKLTILYANGNIFGTAANYVSYWSKHYQRYKRYEYLDSA